MTSVADHPAGDFPDFVWSIGEEGSDPVVLRDGVPFRHDQYAQSGHDEHQRRDLADIAGLGVSIVRYGMPWRLTEVEPGRYDWSLWDRAFEACDAVGLEPIVDLLHFGLPDHCGGFAERRWIGSFVDYVAAFCDRYPTIRWFTPVNEPGITALNTARFGLWNDRLASAADHARVLAHVVLANLEALAVIRTKRPDAMWIGSEGFSVPVAAHPDAADQVERRRALGWLVWDLHLGLDPLPAARGYLDAVDDDIRSRIAALADDGPLIAGHDVYPVGVQLVGGSADPGWSVADRVRLSCDELARWSDRYRRPFWIAETSNLTLPVEQQSDWLETLAAGLDGLRSSGHPVRGLCWYSRGDQFDWQTSLAEPTGAVTEVGLFDTARNPRPVADTFARLATTVPAGRDSSSRR